MDAYLDIETTGLSPHHDDITVVGIALDRGGELYLEQLVGKEVTALRLRRVLKGVTQLYTYNGSRFDLSFLQVRLGVDLEREAAYHDLMLECWARNLYGGLKAVERQLGIPRKHPDINGYEAVLLWRQYIHNSDLRALHWLLEYNKEDVLNLKTLRQRLGC